MSLGLLIGFAGVRGASAAQAKTRSVFCTCVRTVTDIKYYEGVEYSHLHDFGQKSSRTVFSEKIEKLEKEEEFRVRNEVLDVHRPPERPDGWKPVQLPNKIERSSTDVLKAMASCVGTDDTAPAYAYHDDPYLIPYNSMQKRDYLFAKDGGRRAAKYVLDNHPELFEKNLIEAIPKIPRFMPRLKVSEKNASVELLENYVKSFAVSDAITTYELLKEKEIEVDGGLKTALLELICYHNEDDEWDEETHTELAGMYAPPEQRWNQSGFAVGLVSEIVSDEGVDVNLKSKANVALLCGCAKFGEATKALKIYEECKANGVQLDIQCYNAVLACAKSRGDLDERVEAANDVLKEINVNGVKPDEQTLKNYLSVIASNLHQRETRKAVDVALAALAEFKKLRIEPPLSCYSELVIIAGRRSPILFDVVDQLEKIDLQPKIPDDFLAFREIMHRVFILGKPKLAYRVHAIVLKSPALLGDFQAVNVYYRDFTRVLLYHEGLDVAMEFYSRTAPNVWAPHAKFYLEVLDQVVVQGGFVHLPQLWTDLQASRFCSVNVKGKFELQAAFLAAAVKSDAVAEVVPESWNGLFETLLNIAREIFQEVTFSLMPRRQGGRVKFKMTEHEGAIAVFTRILTIASCRRIDEDGDEVVADVQLLDKVVGLCRERVTELQGCLDEDVLQKCLDVAIETGDKAAALSVVAYSAENVTSTSHEMALKASETFKHDLEDVDKNMLNSLFSHETRWTPI